ncbi:MAG: alpha/beta hydrolase [Cyanobacteria bacterium P01_F01_bin.150]
MADIMANIMADIMAYHGWGFDQNYWQDWIKKIKGEGHLFQAFDRGYFNYKSHTGHSQNDDQANVPLFAMPKTTQRILILHSFGLHLCPIETIQQADWVVIFSSFLCFHPQDPRRNRRSKRVLDRMGDRLQSNPLEVLQEFWTNCHAPFSSQPKPKTENINLPLLHQDLEWISTISIDNPSPRLTALQHVTNITIIHGEADQIVPLSQGATLADAVSAPLITIPNAGHALPFSHPHQCWSLAPFTA